MIIAGLLFFMAYKEFGFLATLLLLVLFVALIMFKRRAKILTRLASQLYFINGDIEKAGKLFETAYKTGDMDARCKINYSAFCLRENRFEKGKRLLNEVINSKRTQTNDKLDAKHNLAVLLFKEGETDEAVNMMEMVHKQQPKTDTFASLGVFYLQKAKEENPLNYLPFMMEAYDYNSDDKTICDNLGELYFVLGEVEKAKEIYEKAMTLKFYTPVPYYNYGRVLKALGEKEKAKEYFLKALECKFTSVITITREDVQKELEEL